MMKENRSDLLHTLTAVSYTHLDVYKRQIKKSGSWYSYNDTKLGQGRDAAKQCVEDNPELADELSELIFEALKANK